MRRFAVYFLACTSEIACFLFWLGLLDGLRRDPAEFFEVVLIGPVAFWSIAWMAKRNLQRPPIFLGQLSSYVEEWSRLRAVMREDERLRRLRGM